MKAAEFKGLSRLKYCIGHIRTWKTLPSFARPDGTNMWKFWSWPIDYTRVLSIGILTTNFSENLNEIHLFCIKEKRLWKCHLQNDGSSSRPQCVNPEAQRNVPEPNQNQSNAESVWLVPDWLQSLEAILGNIYANIYLTSTHHRHPISCSYGRDMGRMLWKTRRTFIAPSWHRTTHAYTKYVSLYQ